jgi:hypothetical protein
MKGQGLNGAGLADRIAALTGSTPSPVWVSRRLGGSRPVRLVDVDPDLFVIARALEINRSDLIEIVIRAIFGDPSDQPIPYELTDKVPVGDHRFVPAADHGRPDRCAYARSQRDASGPCFRAADDPAHEPAGVDVEVPPRPTPDEYGDLPVLDPSMFGRPAATHTDGDAPEGTYQ